MSESTFRLRINYTKEERLRYLSHLEIVRCMERCIRRAGLPFAVSQGFSPHMRTAFGWALGVGIASIDEYLDVMLTDYVAVPRVLASFEGVLPKGMRVLGAQYVAAGDKSVTEEFPRSRYECVFACGNASLEQAQTALDELLSIGQITVVRKKKEKVVPFEGLLENVPSFELDPSGALRIEMVTFTEGKGSLRPDLFCAELTKLAHELGSAVITRVEQFS